MQQGASAAWRLWRTALDGAEAHLAAGDVDALAWAAVGFGLGIAAWFSLADARQWLGWVAGGLGLACAAGLIRRWPRLGRALMAMALMAAAGCLTIWAKSALVGARPIARPMTGRLVGTVLAREDLPDGEVRLRLAARIATAGPVIGVRLTAPAGVATADLAEGAEVAGVVRLVPPPPPVVPGARDAARESWFAGINAWGKAYGAMCVSRPPRRPDALATLRRDLNAHILAAVPGSAGGIAATLVTGDRHGVSFADQAAMRDAGLTHLLAISGLHVSAMVAGTYFVVFRLLALIPWLALRMRVPLLAAGAAALSGMGYTALTGAHLPTVRACAGALLLLAAMALGRRAISVRLLAIAGLVVMLAWPEAVIGPSFHLSFGAVLALIAWHESAPALALRRRREEARWRAALRRAASGLIGAVILNLALMPIAITHFHRAGAYGALANLVAIPLVTLLVMPLTALALALDAIHSGWPLWGLVGWLLDALLWLTREITAQPGAAAQLPMPPGSAYGLFLAGGLWLGLWRGWARLAGLGVAVLGAALIACQPPPDLLVGGDGRTIGVTVGNGAFLVISNQPSRVARRQLTETAGYAGEGAPLPLAPDARCNADFCWFIITRGSQRWRLLIARNANLTPATALAPVCAAADIVVAPGPLPAVCRPRRLRLDHAILAQTGGLALDLRHGAIASVAQSEGAHPWWPAASTQ